MHTKRLEKIGRHAEGRKLDGLAGAHQRQILELDERNGFARAAVSAPLIILAGVDWGIGRFSPAGWWERSRNVEAGGAAEIYRFTEKNTCPMQKLPVVLPSPTARAGRPG